MHYLTDLKSCYDRQLVNIGGLIEESIGRDRHAMQLTQKITPRWKHYVSTAFGVSEECYGGEENELAGTGQGNKFSGEVCRDTSCLIIKVLEKRGLGMKFGSKLTKVMVLIAAIAFVDDADLVAEGIDAESKMKIMLKLHDDLFAATGGYIEQNKSKFFAWKWKWK